MFMHPLRQRVFDLLAAADVHPGGSGSCDPQIHDDRFYARVLAQGSLGLGESYMDGCWDVASLDGLLFRLLRAGVDYRVPGLGARLDGLRAWVRNLQTARRAALVGERHYDIGNDLFQAMLGRRMVYSCGYWREANDLDAAQEAKLDLVCRKLGLRPGMRVLDIGCGWGEALRFAA
ncbi:MAG: class I SAM-dependent methyltransferase, partial [Luteimonas sp.]